MVRKARTTRITRELSVFLDMRSTVLVAGFALLSGAQCEFPEDASAVDVSWKGYTGILSSDLRHFHNIRYAYFRANEGLGWHTRGIRCV